MQKKLLVTGLSLLTAIQLHSFDDVNLTTENLLDMDFDQLLEVEVEEVYGASKVVQKITEAPSSVSIISSKDIKKFGFKTLGDAVASQSGFYTYYDRNYQYLGVRGFGRPGDYNTRILLMVDGQRMNDNIYDAASVGTDFPVELSLVDHIEVIRGPGSSLYGTSAFFAVINVITKDTKDFENGMISAEVGSFSTDKETFLLSHAFDNGANILVSATRYQSDGDELYFKEFDDPETNNGKSAKKMDADSYRNLFIKASLGDFKIQAIMNKREKTLPTAAWGMEFNDPNAITTDEHGHLTIKHDKQLNNKWQVSSQIAYNHYNYEGSYPYAEEGEIVVYKDDTPGSWIDGNIDLKYKTNDNNQWLFGTYYYKNLKQNMKYYYDEETINEVAETTDSYAFYLQNIYKYSDKLTFTSGLRYDDYETFGSTINPRIAAVYQLQPLTSLKLLYGQAFRAPNIYERLYADGEESQKENPDLNPEKIKTYEIVLEHYFKNSDSITLSGFYYKIDDLITQVEDESDELLIFQNVDEVESKGVEFSYKKSFENGIKTGINYTYQDTVDSKTDKTLSNSPKHIGNIFASTPLFDEKYNLGTTLQYSASRDNPNGETLDSFVVANMTLIADDVVKGLDISASVYNLFDTQYSSSPGEEHEMREIIQDGISARIKATYRF